MIYDNYSEDGSKDLLQPYIDAGQVYYTLWPPENKHVEVWDDSRLESHYLTNLERCYNRNEETKHIQLPCQQAAFDDAIRRTRGKVRWLGAIDVDEFFYVPENSSFWNVSSTQPLVTSLKNLEKKYAIVTIMGQHFGTSGWLSYPRRDDDQNHSQLVTKTHLHHMEYHGFGGIRVSEHLKPFANPMCVHGNGIHAYEYTFLDLFNNFKYTAYDTNDTDNTLIYMNHYLWPSWAENIEKAIVNRNPQTTYVEEYDRMMNKEKGSNIEYLLDRLELKMQDAVRTKPPMDGHADDWDFRIQVVNKKNPQICVILMNPRHIGLARHSLTSIIYYFHTIEPSLEYTLSMFDPEPHIKRELERDFPIIVEKEEFCEYILRLKESSFARWERWPTNKPVMEMAMQVFIIDSNVHVIYLTDSSNLMMDWNRVGEVSYRNNPDLTGTLLMKKKKEQVAIDSFHIFEICLHTQDACENNQVRGLFENYKQERMYGYT